MHYYQFNIGDYASHTRHLSPIEDIAYRRLLDLYYLHEQPLNSGIASVARQIGMKEYESEVGLVLEEFFTLSDQGWVSSRADKVIANYHLKIEQASKAGKASAERRSNARSTNVQPTNNHKPITKNQEPKKNTTDVAAPIGVSPTIWFEFVALRKTKKAKVTQTVLDGLQKEADKAGWTLEQVLKEIILRNWQSFKADWVQPRQTPVFNKFDVANVTTPTPPNQDAALRKIEEDRKNAVPPSLETLAKLAELRKGVVQ